MRSNRRFSPLLDSMPIRITPSDGLNPMAPVIIPYGPIAPPPPPVDPMAPVIIPYAPTSPYMYADT